MIRSVVIDVIYRQKQRFILTTASTFIAVMRKNDGLDFLVAHPRPLQDFFFTTTVFVVMLFTVLAFALLAFGSNQTWPRPTLIYVELVNVFDLLTFGTRFLFHIAPAWLLIV